MLASTRHPAPMLAATVAAVHAFSGPVHGMPPAVLFGLDDADACGEAGQQDQGGQ
jgi:citrate synthase